MTNLMGMSFRDFFWKVNPTKLDVLDSRNTRETVLPYFGSETEDLGPKKRKVTGEGYFTGEDCWEQWKKLRAVYQKGGPGSLRLPGQQPFLAVMDELKLMGAAGKDLVKYSFSFTETESGQQDALTGTRLAKEGESLWDYAYLCGRPVEELIACNPDIRDIAWLTEGEEVRLP